MEPIVPVTISTSFTLRFLSNEKSELQIVFQKEIWKFMVADIAAGIKP